ncbi:MAG: hypothetical protein ACOCX3_00345 [Chloroflexota bacterium]
MSDKKQNFLDDVVEGTRRLLEDLEKLFNHEKRKGENDRTPIPVPVRREDPYERHTPPYR